MRRTSSLFPLMVGAATFLMSASALNARTRHYYIQAEDVTWDFAPSNQDLLHGGPIPDPWTDSHVFQKTRYIEYADGSFNYPKPQPVWLDALGGADPDANRVLS